MTEPSAPGTALTVRALTDADAPAMRALFAAIFNKDMSEALWNWKYARPQSAALGIWRGDELLAHYGGMGSDIWFKGAPATAMQICDVMVNPSVRQAVRKQSPFYQSTSAFLERYLGYGKPWLLGYGFPSDRHMDLAAHLKLYAPVGRMWELNWDLPVQPRVPFLLTTVVLHEGNFARYRATLDALAEQQRTALADRILVRKNAALVAWRYLNHPQESYTLILVRHRLTGKAVGLCVLKVEADRVLWMDALAPPANLPALAQVARAATWLLLRPRLSLWCSEPDVQRFGNVSDAQPMPITTPANIWTPGPAPEELKDRWWLLAGDSDYL
ncbi:MAG: hypothetical protein RLZZ227_697 [Pseudomonadota bacterium]|jgi:hypothetical protein